MSRELFAECDSIVFDQAADATRYPGVVDVVITPDAHAGYGVPVGCVLATNGTLCQAPVGYDIGCGMMAFRSDVPNGRGLEHRLRQRFSEEVMARIGLGVGVGGNRRFDQREFQEIIRHGAAALGYERVASERDFIPVDDTWDPPGDAVHRGIGQLGSLGGGNHFCELQYDQNGHLWVMVHTGSRGFGHALATHFMNAARSVQRKNGQAGNAAVASFEPDSPLYDGYRNAIAAGANFAIVHRLMIWEGVGAAFKTVFGREPELVYEISHNLAQEEITPSGERLWVHRKGATRAFPAGHPMLAGTRWEETGHPILIPGSMGDASYVVVGKGNPVALCSSPHGAGREYSRSAARRTFTHAQLRQRMTGIEFRDTDAFIDEIPDAYKPIDRVMADAADLVGIRHELRQLINVKGA